VDRGEGVEFGGGKQVDEVPVVFSNSRGPHTLGAVAGSPCAVRPRSGAAAAPAHGTHIRRYYEYSSGVSRNSLAIIPIVMSPGWMASVGSAVAMGLILTKGGSSGSAQMTCRLLPNHCLILSMWQELPA